MTRRPGGVVEQRRAIPLPGMAAIRRISWEIGNNTFSYIVAFASIGIIASAIGMEGYGTYLVLTIALTFATLSWNNAAIDGAAARYLTSPSAHGRWARYLGINCAIAVVIGVALGAIFGSFMGVIALTMAIVTEAVYVRAIPAQIASKGQRTLALANGMNQATRLAMLALLGTNGWLSPELAIATHAAGYIVGALILGSAPTVQVCSGTCANGGLWGLMPIDALRWAEKHLPLLGIAAYISITAAAQFSILLKVMQALVVISVMVGRVTLPFLAGRQDAWRDLLSQILMMAAVIGGALSLLFVVGAPRALALFTGNGSTLWGETLALAPVVLVAPWMSVVRVCLLIVGKAKALMLGQGVASLAGVGAGAISGWGMGAVAAVIAVGCLSQASLLTIAFIRSFRAPVMRRDGALLDMQGRAGPL